MPKGVFLFIGIPPILKGVYRETRRGLVSAKSGHFLSSVTNDDLSLHTDFILGCPAKIPDKSCSCGKGQKISLQNVKDSVNK